MAKPSLLVHAWILIVCAKNVHHRLPDPLGCIQPENHSSTETLCLLRLVKSVPLVYLYTISPVSPSNPNTLTVWGAVVSLPDIPAHLTPSISFCPSEVQLPGSHLRTCNRMLLGSPRMLFLNSLTPFLPYFLITP